MSSSVLTNLEKMKRQIIIEVEDPAYEPVVGMLKLCNGVTIVSDSHGDVTKAILDQCVVVAINELRNRNVLRRAYDYTYIMLVINQENIDRHLFFASPQDYIDYLSMFDVDRIPGKTSIYDMMSCTRGEFPNWQFSDRSDNVEALRRNNVAKQFLSAYYRARRDISEGFSEK